MKSHDWTSSYTNTSCNEIQRESYAVISKQKKMFFPIWKLITQNCSQYLFIPQVINIVDIKYDGCVRGKVYPNIKFSRFCEEIIFPSLEHYVESLIYLLFWYFNIVISFCHFPSLLIILVSTPRQSPWNSSPFFTDYHYILLLIIYLYIIRYIKWNNTS